jgi:hypothetical protein
MECKGNANSSKGPNGPLQGPVQDGDVKRGEEAGENTGKAVKDGEVW